MDETIEVPVRVPTSKHKWDTGAELLEAMVPLELKRLRPEDAPVGVEILTSHTRLRVFDGLLWEPIGTIKQIVTPSFGSLSSKGDFAWNAYLGRLFQREQLFLGQQVKRVAADHDEATVYAVARVQALAERSIVVEDRLYRRTVGPTMYPWRATKRKVELVEQYQSRLMDKISLDMMGHCSVLDRKVVIERMEGEFSQIEMMHPLSRVLSMDGIDMDLIRLDLARMGVESLFERLKKQGVVSIGGMERNVVAAMKSLREENGVATLSEMVETSKSILESMPDDFFDEQLRSVRKALVVVLDHVQDTSVPVDEKARAESSLDGFAI